MKILLIFLPALLLTAFILVRNNEQVLAEPVAKTANIVYCTPGFDPELSKGKAPLLSGLGKWNYPITSSSKKAKQFFNQGLALTYGFNHGEAARSFRTAISLDSNFAMAWWGLAMVLGPNYNAALNPSSLGEINEAVDKAMQFAPQTSLKEQALIAAIAKRFPREEVKDMAPYYEAYAQAMKSAHNQFPDDAEIATLYADALMNLHPWDLWFKDGKPKPWTPEIISLLEQTLEKHPDHPGTIHYYIHATEASREPAKALPYADKLREAMPAAGHLVHMPSHTYIRTGDYHKGVIANEKAMLADSTYIAQCRVQGAYPLLLYPHNIHFLAACAFLEGDSRKAIESAWLVSRKADRKYILENVTVQHYYSIPFYVLVHLGKWQEILELKQPDERLKYPVAIWHYARGMAFAASGQRANAVKELELVQVMLRDKEIQNQLIWEMNRATDLIQIAAYILEGEIQAREGKYQQAIENFRKAIAIEDALNYNEPPDWFFSVRLTLGHWLVKAGQFEEAEAVYRQDLTTFPENGWALKGLFNSLSAQGKKAEAQSVNIRFELSWKHADMKIELSRGE